MNVVDIFELGTAFRREGKTEVSIEIWKKCTALDPNFSPVRLQLFNVYKSQGLLEMAKGELLAFMNCPLNGFTIDQLENAKKQLVELDRQLSPQPPQPPPAPAK